MVEQWPFKPLVESSSLSSLTKNILIGCFFIGWSPIEGCIRALLALFAPVSSPSVGRDRKVSNCVFYWLESLRGIDSRPSRSTLLGSSLSKHSKACSWKKGAAPFFGSSSFLFWINYTCLLGYFAQGNPQGVCHTFSVSRVGFQAVANMPDLHLPRCVTHGPGSITKKSCLLIGIH